MLVCSYSPKRWRSAVRADGLMDTLGSDASARYHSVDEIAVVFLLFDAMRRMQCYAMRGDAAVKEIVVAG